MGLRSVYITIVLLLQLGILALVDCHPKQFILFIIVVRQICLHPPRTFIIQLSAVRSTIEL
jgi:hypothetical protein